MKKILTVGALTSTLAFASVAVAQEVPDAIPMQPEASENYQRVGYTPTRVCTKA